MKRKSDLKPEVAVIKAGEKKKAQKAEKHLALCTRDTEARKGGWIE